MKERKQGNLKAEQAEGGVGVGTTDVSLQY